MSNVYFAATVSEDGTLALPAFSVRGLGFAPGDTVRLAMPLKQPGCGLDCFTDEVFIARCCPDSICGGYTTDGASLNLPARLFALADVPVGAEVTLMAGDNALVLVAGTNDCAGLPDAIAELLADLGIEPEKIAPVGKDF